MKRTAVALDDDNGDHDHGHHKPDGADTELPEERVHRIMMAHAARSEAWHRRHIDAYSKARLENNKRSSYLGILATDMADAVLMPYLINYGESATGLLTSERPYRSEHSTPLACSYFSSPSGLKYQDDEPSSSCCRSIKPMISFRLRDDDHEHCVLYMAAGGPRRETYAFSDSKEAATGSHSYLTHRRLPTTEELTTAYRRDTLLDRNGLPLVPRQAPMGPHQVCYLTNNLRNYVERVSLVPDKDIALITMSYWEGSVQTSVKLEKVFFHTFPVAITAAKESVECPKRAQELYETAIADTTEDVRYLHGVFDYHWPGAAHVSSRRRIGCVELRSQLGIQWYCKRTVLASDDALSESRDRVVQIILPCEPGQEPREPTVGLLNCSRNFWDNEFPVRTAYSIHSLSYEHYFEKRDHDGSGAALPYCYCIVTAVDVQTGLRKPSITLQMPEVYSHMDQFACYLFVYACVDARGNFVAVMQMNALSWPAETYVLVWTLDGQLIRCDRLEFDNMSLPTKWLINPDGFLCAYTTIYMRYFCLDEDYVDWDALQAQDELRRQADDSQ